MSLENIGLGALLQFEEQDAVRRVGRFQAAIDGARKGLSDMGRGLGTMRQGAGQTFGAVKSIALPAMLGASAATGLAVAATVRFDESINKIGTALGKAEFAKVRGDLEDLAKTMATKVPTSASDAARAMETLVKAGVQVKDLNAALGPVLAASIAEGMPTEQAAQIIVATVNQFGMGMQDAARAANALSKAADASNASISSIGEGMTYVGPIAHKMGMDIEQTSAALAILDNAGQKGSVGGTHLAAALESMTSPRHAQWFKALGVSITDSTGKMRPFMDVLQDVTVKLNAQKNEQKRFVAATRLFGEQGGLAVLALASAGRKGFDDMEQRVRNGTVTVQEKADIMGSSFSGMAKRIGAALEVLAIDITQTFGADLQTGLKTTLAFTQDVIKAFEAMRGGNTGALVGLDPTAVAVAQGLKAAIDGIRQAFTEIKPHLVSFMQSLTPERVAMFAKAAVVFAMLAPPLLILTPILSAVASAIGGIMTMFGGATTVGSGLVGVLSSIGSYLAAIPGIGWIVAAVIATVNGIVRDLSNTGSSWLMPVLNGFWISLKEIGTSIWDLIKALGDVLMPIFDVVGDVIAMLIAVALTPLTWAFRLVSLVISTVVEMIAAAVKQIGRFFRYIADGVSDMKNTLGSMPGMRMFLGSAAVAPGNALSSMREALGLAERTQAASAGTVVNASEAARLASEAEARSQMNLHDALQDSLNKAQSATAEAQRLRTQNVVDEVANAVEEAFKRAGMELGENMSQAIADGMTKAELKADITTNVNVDGQQLARSTAKAQLELKERAGSKTTPQQRRMVLERGIPAK